MTIGSLFDGSGGFPLGARMCGMETLWSSEVSPFPLLVEHKNFPNTVHYGDVSQLNGAEIAPVDIVTFGSPCQDLSIAGLRRGLELEGGRSNLFYQAVRIIKEMRGATNGEYPKYAVWENVGGAFGSNGGEDFRSVLQSLASVSEPEVWIPRPEKASWPHCGEILGDHWSISWRLFDAQFHGVPQRRQRIYLVADFRGQRAGEIQFKFDGLPGDTDQNFDPRKSDATVAPSCNRTTDRETETARTTRELYENHGTDSRYTGPLEVSQTLCSRMGTGGNNAPLVVKKIEDACINTQSSSNKPWISYGNTGTITAAMKGNYPIVFRKDQNSCKISYKETFLEMLKKLSAVFTEKPKTEEEFKTAIEETINVVDTIKESFFKNSHNVNKYCYRISSKSSHSFKSNNPYSGVFESNIVKTLDTKGNDPSCNQGGNIIVELSTTLRACDAFTGTIKAPKDNDIWFLNTGKFPQEYKGVAGTICARDYKDAPLIYDKDNCKYVVRRVTPIECARLQGFPDDWTDNIEITDPTEEQLEYWQKVWDFWNDMNGKKHRTKNQIKKWLANPYSDRELYCLWGNGVALPCVYLVLSAIKYVEEYKNCETGK